MILYGMFLAFLNYLKHTIDISLTHPVKVYSWYLIGMLEVCYQCVLATSKHTPDIPVTYQKHTQNLVWAVTQYSLTTIKESMQA